MSLIRVLVSVFLALLLVSLAAAVLFAGWTVLQATSWEDAGLDSGPDAGEWVWLEGRPFCYREWNADGAHTIALVHGHQVEGIETWTYLAERLASAGYRVVAVDLAGFGYSYRDIEADYDLRERAHDLAQVLNERYVQEATLVSYGQGAETVIKMAAEQPQIVERAVLIAPRFSAEARRSWPLAFPLPPLERGMMWLVECGGPLWQREQVRCFHNPAALPEGYWERVTRPTHVVGTLDALRIMMRNAQPISLADLEEIERPVLLLAGEYDTSGEETKDHLLDQLPDVTLQTVPQAGSCAHIESPRRTQALITAFIAQESAE